MKRVYIDEIEKELSKSAIGSGMEFPGLAAAMEDDFMSVIHPGVFKSWLGEWKGKNKCRIQLELKL